MTTVSVMHFSDKAYDQIAWTEEFEFESEDEAAQYLVEAGFVGYACGSWAYDPQTIANVMTAR